MMNTREALEKKIDENPLDPTPHLVIADWFDENDMPDEASFRRAMGKWITRHGHSIYNENDRSHPWGFYTSISPYISDEEEDRERIERGEVPVPTRMIPSMWKVNSGIGPHVADRELYPPRYKWATYRGMEKGLRQAFMENLRRSQSEKMARRARASKLVRWKF